MHYPINRRQFFKAGAASLVVPAISASVLAPAGVRAQPTFASPQLPLRPEYRSLATTIVHPGNGRDSLSAGDSELNPWNSIAYAVKNASPGTVVLIRGGTHRISSRDVTGDSGQSVAIMSPQRSGASVRAPIVFANYPGERVTLMRAGTINNGAPVDSIIGANGRSHVWFDGLICDGENANVRVATGQNGCVGLRIRHCTLRNTRMTGGAVNRGLYYSGETHTDTLLENNLFQDARTTDGNDNQGAMMVYNAIGMTIRYCVYDNITCNNILRDKALVGGGGAVNRYYRNWIKSSCRHGDWALEAKTPDQGTGANTCLVFENLFANAGRVGFTMGAPGDTSLKDSVVSFNTLIRGHFGHGSDKGFDGQKVHPNGIGDFRIFGNLLYLPGEDYAWHTWMNDGGDYSDGQFSVNDYNGYVVRRAARVGFEKHYNPTLDRKLAQWRALGFDRHSVVTTVDPFRDSKRGDYRLAEGSEMLRASKRDGTASGSDADMGCFTNDYWLDEAGPRPM